MTVSTIRFMRPNQYGRAVGAIDTGLGGGVHQTLVQRGIAEFVNQDIKPPIAQAADVAEPTPDSVSEGVPEDVPESVSRRDRKRRHNHEESMQ